MGTVQIGHIIGAFIAIYLLSELLRWAIIGRLVEGTVEAKLTSIAIAWVVATTAYALGSNAQFLWSAVIYGIPAGVLAGVAHLSGEKVEEA